MAAEPMGASQPQSPNEDADYGDVPIRLSSLLQGTLTLTFDSGAAATRRTSQSEARAFLAKEQDAENDDDIQWSTRHWFTWDNHRLVFSAFDADTDQNFSITPDERERFAANGHQHGIVVSLIEMWEQRSPQQEPTYSPRAIATLHRMALDGADRRTWEGAARLFEGTRGAQEVSRIWHDAHPGQTSPPSATSHNQPAGGPREQPESGIERTGYDESRGDTNLPSEPPLAGEQTTVADASGKDGAAGDVPSSRPPLDRTATDEPPGREPADDDPRGEESPDGESPDGESPDGESTDDQPKR